MNTYISKLNICNSDLLKIQNSLNSSDDLNKKLTDENNSLKMQVATIEVLKN